MATAIWNTATNWANGLRLWPIFLDYITARINSPCLRSSPLCFPLATWQPFRRPDLWPTFDMSPFCSIQPSPPQKDAAMIISCSQWNWTRSSAVYFYASHIRVVSSLVFSTKKFYLMPRHFLGNSIKRDSHVCDIRSLLDLLDLDNEILFAKLFDAQCGFSLVWLIVMCVKRSTRYRIYIVEQISESEI